MRRGNAVEGGATSATRRRWEQGSAAERHWAPGGAPAAEVVLTGDGVAGLASGSQTHLPLGLQGEPRWMLAQRLLEEEPDLPRR